MRKYHYKFIFFSLIIFILVSFSFSVLASEIEKNIYSKNFNVKKDEYFFYNLNLYNDINSNISIIKQIGFGNRVNIDQYGTDNIIEINQDGTKNIASIYQNGKNNEAYINQIGEVGYEAHIIQIGGDNNWAKIEQKDSDNKLYSKIEQYGNKNRSYISNDNIINNQKNKKIISQYGNNNSATTELFGSLGLIKITQLGQNQNLTINGFFVK